ncbi:MAG: PilZ domain-containing protein [Gemmataceae bacterium]
MDGDDRRAETRRPIPIKDSNPLVATVGLMPRPALVADLSGGGLSVLLTDPLTPGTLVPVWLAGDPGRPSRLLLAQVMNVSIDDGPLFRVGLMAIDDAGRAVLADVDRRQR